METQRILAIDLGYSSVKVCYLNENGVATFEKYNSAVAKLPEKPLELDNDVVFKLGVDYYVMGTAALRVPRSYLLPLETYEDLRGAYLPHVSYLLQKFGGHERFDRVAIGLSMAFVDKADDLLNYLYENLLIEKGSNYFVCLPQGLSCKLAYSECGLNIGEVSKHKDFKLQNYLILDGGFLTCDICSVTNGNAAAGSAVGLKNTGTIVAAYDLADYIYKTYEFRVSIKESQTIIEDGGSNYVRRGKRYDLSEKVDEICIAYLGRVLELLDNKFSEALDVADGVLICGGLGYLFKRYITDPRLVEKIEKYFPISFIQIPETLNEFYNVYSYMKIAEKL